METTTIPRREELSFLSQLRDLQVGESITMPISHVTSVRTMASIVSLQQGRRLVTRTNRESGTITVTRTA